MTVRSSASISRRAAAALLLAACSASPDPERERQTLASWGAAVAEATGEWSSAKLPTHFVVDLLDASVHAFEEQDQPIANIVSRPAHDELFAAADSLREAASRLRGDVERGDRRSAQRERMLVRRIAARLHHQSEQAVAP